MCNSCIGILDINYIKVNIFNKNLRSNLDVHWILGFPFLFLLIILFFFKFNISYNEMDVIPYAKAVFNDDWLENDWYLNLTIPYRFFFSYPVGFFADTFGIIQTIIFGRFVSYILVALSLCILIKSIKSTSYSFLYYLSIILFFTFYSRGIGAVEWMAED